MMQFTFDLISDLHIDTWNEPFDWSGKATSAHCVVAGDISEDRSQVVECLANLGRCYQAVFYIDGNVEHNEFRGRLNDSYLDLSFRTSTIPNVVYLQDNVVVIDGVALLGTNGWWGYQFDSVTDPEQSELWYRDYHNVGHNVTTEIKQMATNDANYMISSVRRLQTHKDVKKIVMVTHTVPAPELIEHDIDLEGSLRFNSMGNRLMQYALTQDTENKLHTWCFGHYHGSVDQTRNGIRYVNNCRGRGDTKYCQWVYHPKRITIDY